MAHCSLCEATEAAFGPEVARADLARYRRRGPDDTTRLLIEGVRAAGFRGDQLLDIGAGIGVIHHELLADCVAQATHVDVSAACIAVAQEEDARRGHRGRVRYVVGDALEVPLPAADAVVLDRAICCYPDWETLVRRSAAKARHLYAFSVPHDRWYTRAMTGFGNLVRRLRGRTFRVFVHPVAALDRLVAGMGFERTDVRGTPLWHVALYRRKRASGLGDQARAPTERRPAGR